MQITALKNYEQQNTATSGRLIKAVYASYVDVYISCTSYSGRLEYNSIFLIEREGGGVVTRNERKICH